MIEDLGIAGPEDVGYYSGMVDSSFSFAQLLTVRILFTTFSSRTVLTTAPGTIKINRFISGHHSQTASVVNQSF